MLQVHKKRPFFYILCILFVAVLLSALLPGYRYFKVYRAESLAEEAQQYLKDKDYAQAREKARAAYALVPNNIFICQTVAKVYETTDPERSLPFWEQAYELSGEHYDLRHWVEAALISNQFENLEAKLEQLEKTDIARADFLLLKADFLVRNKRIVEATEIAQEMVALPDAKDEAHLFFVQVSQFSESPEVRKAGIAHLRKIAARNDALGLKGLRNLAGYKYNSSEERLEIKELITRHPEATRKDKLVALRLGLSVSSSDLATTVSDAKALFDLRDPTELMALGRWFNQMNLHYETLELISEEQATRRRDLLLVRLDAMAVLNQWENIAQLMETPGTDLDYYLKLLFKARVYLETGQTDKADIAWSRAKLAVSNDPEKLWYLADYADKLTLTKERRSVLERLTEIPSNMRKAYEELIRLEQKQGETRRLRDTFERMFAAYPNDVAVANDLAYTNLLLNENLDTSFQSAEQLVQENPSYLSNRVTLALALLRNEKGSDALALLQELPVNWNKVKFGWRAVYAAILRENGLASQADSVLNGIDLTQLLPEEKYLLSYWGS